MNYLLFLNIFSLSHRPISLNVLRIKEVAEGNLGKSLISLLSAVRRNVIPFSKLTRSLMLMIGTMKRFRYNFFFLRKLIALFLSSIIFCLNSIALVIYCLLHLIILTLRSLKSFSFTGFISDPYFFKQCTKITGPI